MSPLSPSAVAERLGTFTRRQFAEAVGVTPLAAGKYLKTLEEKDRITRDGRGYKWDPIEDRPASPEAPSKRDDPRVAARKLNSFTVRSFASATGTSESVARERIKTMIREGVVRASGDKEWRDHGPAAMIYEVVPLPKHNGRKPSHAKSEEARLRREATRIPSGPVAGTGTSLRSDLPRDEGMRDLAERVRKAGGKVTRSGSDHFKAILPNGRVVGLSNTPDKNAWKKAAAEMRRQGFNPDKRR